MLTKQQTPEICTHLASPVNTVLMETPGAPRTPCVGAKVGPGLQAPSLTLFSMQTLLGTILRALMKVIGTSN